MTESEGPEVGGEGPEVGSQRSEVRGRGAMDDRFAGTRDDGRVKADDG